MLCTQTCLALLVSLLLVSTTAVSEVYKVVDQNGKVTYTDNPPADNPTTESVDLPTINTQPAPALQPQTEGKAAEATDYSQVSITNPAHDSTVPPGQLSVNVQISTEPALQLGHGVQLFYDNQPYNEPVPATSFQISGMERGEHTLQAKIIDEVGNILLSSNTITFYVKRSFVKKPTGSSAPATAK